MPLSPTDPANPDEHYIQAKHRANEDHAARALRKCDEDMAAEAARQAPGEWSAPVSGAPATLTSGGQGHPIFLRLIGDMERVHLLKSGGYGTGKDPFANFTAIAAVSGRRRFEYPIERIIEKCTRAMSLIEQGRVREVGEEFVDIAGLALCAESMRQEDTSPDKHAGPRVGG